MNEGQSQPMPRAETPSKIEIRIALGLTAALLFALVLLNTVLNKPLSYDFSAMYAAGQIVRQGHGSKLYDLNEQMKVEKELGRNRLLVYAQPPLETLFFIPLTKLSYPAAYVLWGAFNVLLWIFFQYLVRPAAPVPRQPYYYLMACSLFFPLWAALIQGQMSILLLVMFSLAFVHLERHQDYRSGFFLGLGLFKFPVVLPFAVICFLRRKWRLMGGFATATLLFAGLSLAAVGPGGIVSYVKMLAGALASPRNATYATSMKPSDMATLRGLFFTLFPHLSPHWTQVAAGIAGAILIIATAWVWWRRDMYHGERSSAPIFAAALTVSLATSPHAQVHDMSLMLLAILLVLGSHGWRLKPAWSVARSVCIVILYLAPVYVFLLRHHELSLLCPVLLCFAIATLRLSNLPSPVRVAPEPIPVGSSAPPG